jgi:hypothetical protein
MNNGESEETWMEVLAGAALVLMAVAIVYDAFRPSRIVFLTRPRDDDPTERPGRSDDTYFGPG